MTDLSNTHNNQQQSPMPFDRYRPFVPVDVPDRTWPARRITQAPRWLSTDLRDGNQALIDPMTPARKMAMFELLVSLGYKEIEVGFPSRRARPTSTSSGCSIEEDRIPDDVQISVLTQAREDLIERTVQSLVGADRATVHLYNATAPLFQRVVFGVTPDECLVDRHPRHRAGGQVRRGAAGRPGGHRSVRLPVQPRDLHPVRHRLRAAGVRGGLRRVAARGRSRDHPQPAGHRGDVHAQHLRRPDRVLLPRAHPARAQRHQPAPAQRPGHRRGRDRARPDGRCRPGRGLPVRPRRADRQRRPGDPRR